MSSFRDVLILINAIAVMALVVFIFARVVRLRRNPEVKAPQNAERFFDDEVLEGPHLERVLGIALAALVVAVIALIVYFIWEPFRGADAVGQFKDQSVERGAVLFANKDSVAYDATKSLLCADCHGTGGTGGVANFIVKSQDPRCDPKQTVDAKLAETQPYCLPHQVHWEAPNLTLAGLRYSRAQLTQIITYGRPGTPMPAWGVASGKGVLNPQGIADLVNYVESLVTTPDKAQAEADKQVAKWRSTLDDPAVRAAAAKWVADAKADLASAQAQAAGANVVNHEQLDATVVYMQDVLNVAQQWQASTQSASDGQVLFMANTGCARCHTRGWSWFDPTNPEGNPPPGIMGGGAFGSNLTGGDVNAQFPPPTGETDLFGWISVGVDQYQQYGIRGISSGRMAHFGAVLTKDQIEAIMAYERSL